MVEELGLEPGPELRRLEEAILAHDEALVIRERAAVPAPRSDPRPPTNVRPALSSFVGRRDDLVRVAELLELVRLVTLVGPGGCGKTRLAVEVAIRRLADVPGGVWFVALDGVATGDAVLSAVTEAVSARVSSVRRASKDRRSRRTGSRRRRSRNRRRRWRPARRATPWSCSGRRCRLGPR